MIENGDSDRKTFVGEKIRTDKKTVVWVSRLCMRGAWGGQNLDGSCRDRKGNMRMQEMGKKETTCHDRVRSWLEVRVEKGYFLGLGKARKIFLTTLDEEYRSKKSIRYRAVLSLLGEKKGR